MIVLLITNLKGGTGKTIVAFNLMVELSKYNQVGYLDLDYQMSLTQLLKIRSIKNQNTDNIYKISDLDELKRLKSKNIKDEITIIDSAGADSVELRSAIKIADLIITPISLGTLELTSLKVFQKILRELSKEDKKTYKLHLVINKAHPSQKYFEGFKNYYEKFKNFKVLKTILYNRVDFSNSIKTGKSVVEFDIQSKASLEFQNLINEIKKEVQDEKK